MATTWTIANVERHPDTGVIVISHWRATAVEGEYTATAYGTASIPPAPEGVTLKPFEAVTEADVLKWTWFTLDKAETEANLAKQIEEQKAPKVVAGLPW